MGGAVTKAPGGGEAAGRSPVDRGKQGMKRSGITDGYGIPLGRVLSGANCHDSPLLAPTLDMLAGLGPPPDETWTAELRGRISLFTEEALDRPQTTAARAARWEIDQLLASAPKDGIPVFSSYQHLCDLARMLRRLVAEHRERTETPLVGSAPEHMTVSARSGSGGEA